MHFRRSAWQSGVVVSLAFGLLTGGVRADEKQDPSGDWTWSYATTRDKNTPVQTVKLKWDGEKLTGRYVALEGTETPISEATFRDGKISFVVARKLEGKTFTFQYEGKLSGDKIVGSIYAGSVTKRTIGWQAQRSKADGSPAGKQAPKSEKKEGERKRD